MAKRGRRHAEEGCGAGPEGDREELTTKDKRESLSHPLKPFPATYKPECKSWCASNSSWNLSSALYARMVQSPWREDDKWENTGLRAGEAETDRKSVRLDVGKPTASRALWLHGPPKSTPRAQRRRAAWGRRDDAPPGDEQTCQPSNPWSHHASH